MDKEHTETKDSEGKNRKPIKRTTKGQKTLLKGFSSVKQLRLKKRLNKFYSSHNFIVMPLMRMLT